MKVFKLGRKRGHRTSLSRSLVISLILHEEIMTTLAKGKLLKSQFDSLVRIARGQPFQARRAVLAKLDHGAATAKLISDIAKRNLNRTSGHTRVFKLSARPGDQAPRVLIRLIDQPFKDHEPAAKNK